MSEAIDTLKERNNLGLVTTVTSTSGGTGKTTIALTLATQLAQSSKRAYETNKAKEPLKVCVVDLDVKDSQLSYIFKKTTPNVLDLFLKEEPYTVESIKSVLIYDDNNEIYGLLAPTENPSNEHLSVRFYTEVIDTLKTLFDVVILDTSSNYLADEILQEIALPLSDNILMVATPSLINIPRVRKWVDTIVNSNAQGDNEVNLSKVGIVINNSSVPDSESIIVAFQEFFRHIPIITGIRAEPNVVQQAMNSSRMIDIVNNPVLGSAYFRLAEAVVKSKKFPLSPIIDDNQ